jgi:hypothetical protein
VTRNFAAARKIFNSGGRASLTTLLETRLQTTSRTFFVSTKPERRPPQLSNAEQETEAAAERLNSQIEAALASVATRNPDDAGELEAYADRIERSARDLSVALRELARRRRNTSDE